MLYVLVVELIRLKILQLKEMVTYTNGMRPPIDIDTVPIPDWDLFEEGSLYRPMQGKILSEQLVLKLKEVALTHAHSAIHHQIM